MTITARARSTMGGLIPVLLALPGNRRRSVPTVLVQPKGGASSGITIHVIAQRPASPCSRQTTDPGTKAATGPHSWSATRRATSLPMNGKWPTSIVSDVQPATLRATGSTGSLGLRPVMISGTAAGAKAAVSTSAVCCARSLPLWATRTARVPALASSRATASTSRRPLRAQRPLWIHLLRERIAVLDDIEPHSPFSLQNTHRLLSTRL